MENRWANILKTGGTVSVSIDVLYEGNDLRPSGFIVKSIENGEEVTRTFINR